MTPFAAKLDRPVLGLNGPDARRFCNSMFTNNARDLPVGAAQRTAMLDDRGRVQGLMDLYCVEEGRFLAVLDGVSAEDFTSRYELYVVLDDVEIVPEEGLACATVQGAPVGTLPAGLWSLARDRSGLGGADVVGPSDAVDAWLAGLELPMADAGWLERARVRAGAPRFPEDFGPKRLAHEMGMRDAFLHFEKGCYVGQETVNRVDVMGQVKRQLAGLSLPADAPVGSTVEVGGKPVGELTSAVSDPELGAIGLAVLRRPHDEPGTVVELVWDGGRGRGEVVALPMTRP